MKPDLGICIEVLHEELKRLDKSYVNTEDLEVKNRCASLGLFMCVGISRCLKCCGMIMIQILGFILRN